MVIEIFYYLMLYIYLILLFLDFQIYFEACFKTHNINISSFPPLEKGTPSRLLTQIMQGSWKWYYQLKYEMQVLDSTWLTNCNHSILLYIFWFLVPKLFKYIWNFLSILRTNMKVVEFFCYHESVNYLYFTKCVIN